MMTFYEFSTNLFDPLHSFWENPKTRRAVAMSQVAAFCIGLVGIELSRRGLLPPALARLTPTSHFYAINLAFTLVLIATTKPLVGKGYLYPLIPFDRKKLKRLLYRCPISKDNS